jgi:hypothetical protein
MKIHTRFPVLFSYLVLLTLPTLLTTQLKAQYILAGVHGAYDYYSAPDTNLTVNYPYSERFYYYVDINGDSKYDFVIEGSLDVSPNFLVEGLGIMPLGNNQAVYIKATYSCDTVLAANIMINDTINNVILKWDTSALSLANQESFMYNSNMDCSDNVSRTDTAIIGVRIFKGTDTLYGWIRLSGVGYDECKVVDYACNTKVTGIENVLSPGNRSPFPNPTDGIINISTNGFSSGTKVEIYNILGEEVYSTSVNNVSTKIDLSTNASGIYMYRVLAEKGELISQGKFIILKKKM